MRYYGLIVALAISLSAIALAKSDGQYFLVDQRTQMPVGSFPVQPNWMAGGKTTWSSNPAAPVSWYVWTMSPDQKCKIFLSSLAVIPATGQMIRQIAFLQNPTILANNYMAGMQRDHNLANIQLADAHFNQRQPDRSLIESRMKMARENGIVPTNFYYTELYIRYEGIRNGGKCVGIMVLPMLATENRPGIGFSTVVELLTPMSFSCPPELEKATQKNVEKMLKGVQMNQNFIAVVNQIAKERTMNWIRVQNEIRNKQMAAASSASETQDRVRDMWSEYIRDVDTVSNPNTGEKMFVDNRYDHAWINSDNEIIYHNNGFNTPNASTSSFDPNSNALFNQTNWRKLK